MILPNIQLSFVLLFAYSYSLKTSELISVIIAYVLIDNMQYGGFGLYTLAMVSSWIIVTLLFKYFTQYISNIYILSLLTIPLSVLYTIPFALIHYIMYGSIIPYLINGISFTLILIANNYITTLWIYPRLITILQNKGFESV